MNRLVLAELNRLRSRRFFVVAMIITLLAVGASMIGVNSELRPPSAAEVASGQRQYEQQKADYEKNKQQYQQGEAECRAQSPKDQQQYCDSQPKLSNYIRQPSPFSDVGNSAATFTTVFLALAMFFAGASFIGAEYSSGSIANWLTFLPERWRVLTAKLLALTGVSLVAGVIGMASALGTTRVLAAVHSQPVHKVGDPLATAGRGLALIIAFALFGFAVALLTRHTAAAAGLVLAYVVINFVLRALMSSIERLQGIIPWLPQNNVLAVLGNGYRYSVFKSVTGPQGLSQEYTDRVLAAGHGVVYLAVLLATALVASYLVFSRRDVS